MRALLEAAGRPLAAPSANASGSISPTRADHVLASLGGRIPLVIDGGPTERGLESTIVAATGGALRLLRPRPDRRSALELEATGRRSKRRASSPAITRPPSRCASNATRREPGEYLIGFGAIAGDATLSASGDLVEAAARLFDLLHEADESGQTRDRRRPDPRTKASAPRSTTASTARRRRAIRIGKRGDRAAAPSLCHCDQRPPVGVAATEVVLAVVGAAGASAIS